MSDLAAPGDQIYSTCAGHRQSYYAPMDFINGRHLIWPRPMSAAPVRLLMAQYPSDTYQETISRLLSATDPLPSLAGKCRTGGRLNLAKGPADHPRRHRSAHKQRAISNCVFPAD